MLELFTSKANGATKNMNAVGVAKKDILGTTFFICFFRRFAIYGFVAVMSAGIIFSVWANTTYVSCNIQTLIYIILLISIGCFSYFSLMKAMRRGDVSFVTPFRYTRILFGVGAGVLLFDETMTVGLILCSIIIIGSGLFLLRPQAQSRNQAI